MVSTRVPIRQASFKGLAARVRAPCQGNPGIVDIHEFLSFVLSQKIKMRHVGEKGVSMRMRLAVLSPVSVTGPELRVSMRPCTATYATTVSENCEVATGPEKCPSVPVFRPGFPRFFKTARQDMIRPWTPPTKLELARASAVHSATGFERSTIKVQIRFESGYPEIGRPSAVCTSAGLLRAMAFRCSPITFDELRESQPSCSVSRMASCTGTKPSVVILKWAMCRSMDVGLLYTGTAFRWLRLLVATLRTSFVLPPMATNVYAVAQFSSSYLSALFFLTTEPLLFASFQIVDVLVEDRSSRNIFDTNAAVDECANLFGELQPSCEGALAYPHECYLVALAESRRLIRLFIRTPGIRTPRNGLGWLLPSMCYQSCFTILSWTFIALRTSYR